MNVMERIGREKRIIGQMIGIYCRKHHGGGKRKGVGRSHDERYICDECRSLLEYAMRRLEHCPKGNAKTSCRKCEIHCYSAANREKIRAVMRYVGPRMLFIHPWSALRHLFYELR